MEEWEYEKEKNHTGQSCLFFQLCFSDTDASDRFVSFDLYRQLLVQFGQCACIMKGKIFAGGTDFAEL